MLRKAQDVLTTLHKNNKLPQFKLIIAAKLNSVEEQLKDFSSQNGFIFTKLEDFKIDTMRRLIVEAQALSIPHLYYIGEAGKLTIQAQNSILKLLEEPPSNCYIVLCTDSEANLLNTIISRATVIREGGYDPILAGNNINSWVANSIEELQFFNTEKSISEVAEKLAAGIDLINTANLYKIPDLIDEAYYSYFLRFLSELFLRAMKDVEKQEINATRLYIIAKYSNRLNWIGVNKRRTLEICLLSLKECTIWDTILED